MAFSYLRLISSAICNPLSSLSPLPPIQNHQHPHANTVFSRRHLAFLSLLALSPPPPATAFSLGISGPKDWLKEQKRKASRFLLAPIYASRDSLRSAYLLITGDSDYSIKDMEDVQGMQRSAARDCVLKDRNSFVEFQANTGVEVCTFTLVVKNASSLLDKTDPVKLEAEAMLDDLIRTFTSLSNLANDSDVQLPSNRLKVADALMDTITSLDKFEKSVVDCLEV